MLKQTSTNIKKVRTSLLYVSLLPILLYGPILTLERQSKQFWMLKNSSRFVIDRLTPAFVSCLMAVYIIAVTTSLLRSLVGVRPKNVSSVMVETVKIFLLELLIPLSIVIALLVVPITYSFLWIKSRQRIGQYKL